VRAHKTRQTNNFPASVHSRVLLCVIQWYRSNDHQNTYIISVFIKLFRPEFCSPERFDFYFISSTVQHVRNNALRLIEIYWKRISARTLKSFRKLRITFLLQDAPTVANDNCTILYKQTCRVCIKTVYISFRNHLICN